MNQHDSRRASSERLAATLLPALVHRVNNATQRLLGVRALVDVSPDEIPARCGEDLSQAARETHDNGWLLGLLGVALDADLLFAREERDGLRPTLELARDALRREGIVLAFDASCVPRLSVPPRGPSTATACLNWAAWVVEASEGAPRDRKLTLAFELGPEFHRVRLDGADRDPWARATQTLCTALVGLEHDATHVIVPCAWFEAAR